MPELPEVQTTVNGLNKHIRGLTITDVWTDYNSLFQRGKDSIQDPAYFKLFKKRTVGRKVMSASRLAKNVLITLDSGDVILVHMKMTGHLMYGDYDRSDPFNRFIHLVFTFDNSKTLELSDMRKFAKVTLVQKNHLE
ncbi:MAG: DNA-formamidopyrimidine glycosylase family protein, partial [Candidatus Pacebacteria bacterium]|nr:DNA-formamidopyrimidine glycosylase family protein [Candidatus Paceibacterota bacterium]